MFLAAAIAMGGAANFKVGVQNRIHDRRERKKCTPLLQMWGTSKQISVEAY